MGKEGTYIRSWPVASTKDNFHNSKLNNNNKTKVVLLAMKCPLACLQYLKKGTEKECKQQVHKNALYFWYTQDTRWFNVDRLPSLTKFQANPHLQIKLWEISLVKIKHGHKANRHVQGHGARFSTVFFCHSELQSQPSKEEEGLQVVLLPVFIKLHVLNLLEQKRNSSLHTLPKTFSILQGNLSISTRTRGLP